MQENKKKSESGKKSIRFQLNLAGLKQGEKRPDIVITATDRDLKPIHVSEVDEQGSFDLPDRILKSAHRILIGPKTDQPQNVAAEDVLRYRPADFEKLLELGTVNISQRIWEKWFLLLRCTTGKVRLCRRRPWWYYELFKLAASPIQRASVNAAPQLSLQKFSAARQISSAKSVSELIYFPFRCQTICNGVVEVYRRTCCCRPWIIDDFRIPELIRDLEDIIRVIPKIPPIPPDPNPPDPPFFAEEIFFKDGSLDEMALNAHRDLNAVRELPRSEIASYINARPYLFCRRSCGAPQRVGQGSINPDGRFNICWIDTRFISLRCHDEYAYIVKQTIGGFTFTVYNGVAANIWYESGDEVTLSSYSPFAFACRDNGEPGSGAYVFLDIIGDTESWNLKTPNAAGWDRVGVPAYNDGLAFPSATPAAAVGANLNRNWGGILKLNYKFSEDMKGIGAKYYRISIVEADNSGNPTGTRNYLSDGLSWEKSVPDGLGGADIVSDSLGPSSAGAENNLYLIPYDADWDWNAGQYHGYLNTNNSDWRDPEKRHLLTLEIFDSNGQRLRPTAAPPTGLPGSEGTAAFTFRRRFQDLGPTAEVPFAALTHLFWWDNRPLVADIVNLNKDGVLFSEECLFLNGTASSTFGIGYRAYHENEMFQLNHSISWQRGLGSPLVLGSTGSLLASSSVNVGKPPASPGNSPTNTFAEMLRTDLDPHRKKCAFTVFLVIVAKTFDGEVTVTPNVQDTAAFAIEIN
ncbi:MAG: hypothetical protein ACR2MG_19220 [Pyrinomonadaceae bacterium]